MTYGSSEQYCEGCEYEVLGSLAYDERHMTFICEYGHETIIPYNEDYDTEYFGEYVELGSDFYIISSDA